MDKLTPDKKTTYKRKKLLGVILFAISSFLMLLLSFTVIWCLDTWKHLRMEELLYELSAPLRGTDVGIVIDYLKSGLAPSIIAVLLLQLVYIEIKRRGNVRLLPKILMAIPVVFFITAVIVFVIRLDVITYIRDTCIESTFIEDNYVRAENVEIAFPEKKRNLIYIYLESMEITYADKESGGAFDKSCIKELTELAKENENFSSSNKLNGAVVLPGTSWTMGGMVAQSCGLPLKISIGENLMNTQKNFFPSITAIGDILNDAGYRQILLIGSDVVFGGRKVFFTDHGNYELHDYRYAKEQGYIPEDYGVWWGYEDEKLFEFAKKELLEISKDDTPFNYTLLTVDSHAQDGYICRLCDDEFGDNSYANVIACSSRQVAAFVKWIQHQDFYDDTTIVLCGDHTTMDSDFCDDVSEDYLRKTYTLYINSAVSKMRKDNIEYDTFDMYPTTLASIGASIQGNRLGLGTNLFSKEQTLIERYGLERVTEELKKNSKFMEKVAAIDLTSEELLEKEGWKPDCFFSITAYDEEKKQTTVTVDDIVNCPDAEKVYVELYDENDQLIEKKELAKNPDRSYTCDWDISKYAESDSYRIVAIAESADKTYTIGELSGDLTNDLYKEVPMHLWYRNSYDMDSYIKQNRMFVSVDYADVGVYKPTLRGEIWDAKNVENVRYFSFPDSEDGQYLTSVNIRGIDTSDCYIKIYGTDRKTKYEYLVVDWHGGIRKKEY